MIGSISEALISLIPEKISDTAPGRTPMAAASPPLDLPVFFSPRSIIFTSSMVIPLFDFQYIPNFIKKINAGFQKSNLTSHSEYRNDPLEGADTNRNGNEAGGISELAVLALRGAEGICHEGH